MKRKMLTFAAACVLVLGFAVGGTLAWLTDVTESVTNTFTVGDINIELTETTGSTYKMVPGNVIAKNPTVTVEAGSEACWLFVKVEKSDNYDTYLAEYVVAEGWTSLDGYDGVYYRTVDSRTAQEGDSYSVLKDDQVTVLETVTKEKMENIKDGGGPTLTFTAYAVQSDNVGIAADAWAIVTGTAA